MSIVNFEFKARANNIKQLEEKLLTLDPVFKGEDHQTDTYFNVAVGRLKLREGNIENALIWYDRPNIADAKQSDIILYQHQPDTSLKDILIKVHGIKVVVDKTRRIYFIDNVKFHFDLVKELGTFVEVEAIDSNGSIGIEKLKQQCDYYFNFFGLNKADYENYSYSDLLMGKNK
ncbi:CYTH domain protein [mine drainage metagenome]|uniref:CYTH domain protein n=1 Tax=mine drainage metagenome TaxID=410659 RepID=A0A1J5RQS0_9ZZZZ